MISDVCKDIRPPFQPPVVILAGFVDFGQKFRGGAVDIADTQD